MSDREIYAAINFTINKLSDLVKKKKGIVQSYRLADAEKIWPERTRPGFRPVSEGQKGAWETLVRRGDK